MSLKMMFVRKSKECSMNKSKFCGPFSLDFYSAEIEKNTMISYLSVSINKIVSS